MSKLPGASLPSKRRIEHLRAACASTAAAERRKTFVSNLRIFEDHLELLRRENDL
jgi:hypothetical protein